MICHQDVHVLSTDGPYDEWDFAAADEQDEGRELSSFVRRAIGRARQWLLGRQQVDGCWVGRTEGDASLESRYVLLSAFLGREQSSPAHRAAGRLIEKQLPDGGWSAYTGGDVDVDVSTLAYFALKLTGHDPSSDDMHRARAAIMAAGGADVAGAETRLWLALLGQIPYDACPAIPPEAVLSSALLNSQLNKCATAGLSSSAATSSDQGQGGALACDRHNPLLPLSIILDRRSVQKIDPRRGIRELFFKHPGEWPGLQPPGLRRATRRSRVERAFGILERAWNWRAGKNRILLRQQAVSAARDWLLREIDDDNLHTDFSSLAWSMIALHCLGYGENSAQMQRCHQRLSELTIDDGDSLRVQPCNTPPADTALTLSALAQSGAGQDDPQIEDAFDWLLSQQAASSDTRSRVSPLLAASEPTTTAPLRVLPPNLRLHGATVGHCAGEPQPPGATAGLSSSALLPIEFRESSDNDLRLETARQLSEACLLASQNRDGGWSATGRGQGSDSDRPDATDSSTPDLTALVLQALGRAGRSVGDPVVDRAIDYLRRSQEADGSWIGRAGVSYLYGTSQVVAGLRAVGVSADDPILAAGINWILAHQQPSGGWGESPVSYTQPQRRGQGPETATQTAWSVLALVAAGLSTDPATLRGVRYLYENQQPDGAWEETEFTATGFPRQHFLRNELHAVIFPLLALSHWSVSSGDHGEFEKAETDQSSDHRQNAVSAAG